YFVCISLNDVLEQLKFTKEQFIDFCIMLGCDFNKRIKGKGCKACFDYITKYKKIESIPDIDVTCLNVEFCREYFKYTNSDELILEGSIELNYRNVEYDEELFNELEIKNEVKMISR